MSMRTSFFTVPVLGLGLVALLAGGCVERRVYVQGPPVVVAPVPGAVVVSDAPPPPPSEVVVVAPSPAYVWVPGYWDWEGRWVWIGGRWAVPPHPHAVWVGGQWTRHGHGYVWIGGRWR